MVPKKKSYSVPFKPDSSLLCGKPCFFLWPNGKHRYKEFSLSKPTNVNPIVIQPCRNFAWFMFGKEPHRRIFSAWKPVTSYKAKMLKSSNLAHSLRDTLLHLAYRIV